MDRIFLALISGAAVLLVVLGLGQLMLSRGLARRATRFVTPQLVTEADIARLGEGGVGQLLWSGQRGGALALTLNRRISRQRYVQSLSRLLRRAGLGITATEFLALRALFTGVLVLLVGSVSSSQPAALRPLYILFGLIAGWLLPMVPVRSLQRRRILRFERQLPDALQMLVGALEGGSGLAAAMALVGREMRDPIAREFLQTMREMALGLTQQEAMLGLLVRVPSEDLDMVVTAVNIQHRVGGNLAHVLEAIAETMRERERVRGEIASLTAQQRLSANIITILPFIVTGILYVTSPNYIRRLFEPGITQYMLFAGLLMVGAGYLMLRRITDIKV
jgi:tight adherence protein B